MQSSVIVDRSSASKLEFVSIIVPVFNQEKQISKALDRIRRVLEEAFGDYEMVVVDDGSTDGTYEVLQRESKSYSKLKIISYKPNRGKGFAVKKGVLESKGSIVLFTDGDLDITPNRIKEYVDQLSTCDLVIASKRHPASRVKAPISRRILSRVFNLFVRVITGIKIKDTQAGMKAGEGEVMRKIFTTMLVKRYAFDVELLVIANLMALNVAEMPLELTIDRRFRTREIIRMLIDVLAISYRVRVRKWYQPQLFRI